MKKIIAMILSIVICAFCGISSLAAGVDDGEIFVTTKESEKYFGVSENDWRTKFTAANGSDKAFYRYHDIHINEDDEMNILDLVRLKKIIASISSGEGDINSDGQINASDLYILRRTLLGVSDFDI